MARILIVQEVIEHYRVPLYERLLTSAGHTIAAFSDHGASPGIVHGNFSHIRGKSYSLLGIKYQTGYWFRVLRGDFDIIVCSFNIRVVSSVVLCLLAALSKRRFVWWGIGYGNNKLLKSFRTILIRLASGIMVYENNQAYLMESNGIKKEKIYVLHNTVYVPHYESVTPEIQRTNIIFVGSVQPRKCLDELIHAFHAALPDLPSDMCLDVIGDGEEKCKLEGLVDSLGLVRRVIFHGRVLDGQYKADIFSRALISVSPGQAGLSVLESFAHGVGFITRSDSISGGEKENIVHGVTGFFYSNGYLELSQLLKSVGNDREIAIKIGKSCYNHYHNSRTIDHMAGRYMSAIFG